MADKTLYEQLSENFPEENTIFGTCLLVPPSAFKPEWNEQLSREGVKVFQQSYNGRVFFFLKKPKMGEVKAELEAQPKAEVKSKLRRFEWTSQDLEMLKRLRAEGVGLEEIAKRLNRPKGSILGKLKALKSGSVLNACHAQPKLEAESRGGNEALFTELLSAAQALYPKFRRASAVLLREAARVLETSPP